MKRNSIAAHAFPRLLTGTMTVLGVSLSLLLASTPAQAQSNCSRNNAGTCAPTTTNLRITITIGRAIHLTLSPASTTLTPPTSADYDLGYTPTTGPTVTVRANTAWSLGIRSGAALWTAVNTQTEPARTTKPAADLLWSTALGGTYAGLTTTSVNVTSGTATAGTIVTLFYRTNYAWTLDTPGNYSIPVVFTLTSP